MPIRTHTCLTLRCDVCPAVFSPHDFDAHLPNLETAITESREWGWTVTADGTVVCHVQDARHRTYFDQLLAPISAGLEAA